MPDPGAQAWADDVARLYLSPVVAERIRHAADPAWAFAEAWTAHEATLKCHKRGLAEWPAAGRESGGRQVRSSESSASYASRKAWRARVSKDSIALGDSPHAWFGPKPGWWPGWLPFSPALIILPFPALFRFTCYYYRGAYYKAFWADPPACTVGEPRDRYLGERYFPLVFQNIHRYFMATAVVFLGFLSYDVWKAL